MRRVAGLMLGLWVMQSLATGVVAHAAASGSGSGQKIAGSVKDALGRPVGDVSLVLQAADGKNVAQVKTNDHGRFEFHRIAPGLYAILANKSGFKTATAIVSVKPGAPAQLDLAMASEAALSVNVVAKRRSRSRSNINAETGGSVYSFSQKAIQQLPQGANTEMSQVLLQAPGVAQDSFGQIHIRGEHADVQYRINGVELPEGITSGFSQSFSPRFAQSISLLVGALPAQYGYQTAGVVQIQTKNGDEATGGDIDMYGGQRGTLEPSFEYGGTRGKLSYYATGFYLQDDRGLEPPTAGPVAIHDTTHQGNGFSYLSYLLNPTTKLSLISGFNVSNFEIPALPGQPQVFSLAGVPVFPSADITDSQLEENYYGVLALQGLITRDLDYQVEGFSRYSTLSFNPGPNGDLIFNGIASQIFRSDFANGLQGDLAYHGWAGHTIRSGFYFSGERAELDNHALVFPALDGAQTSDVPFQVIDNHAYTQWLYGVYVQDEWKPALLPKLTINYGVRFDLYDGLTRADQASPRAGAVYQLFEKTTIHAAYARYFTPPPLEAVSGADLNKFINTTNQPAVLKNDNIAPERAHYFDAGITQALPYGFSTGIDSYYKMSTDLLDEGQFGPTLIFTPFNYAKGRQYGVEFTNSLTRSALSAYANFAYGVAQGTKIVSDQFLFSPAELSYISSHYVFLDHDQTFTASAGIAYTLNGFVFSVDGVYGSGLRSGFANTGNLPFYIQVDAGVTKAVVLPRVGRVEARVAVINMGDDIYQIRNGSGIGVFAAQYGPRRALYGGLKWEIPWLHPAPPSAIQ